MKLFKRIAILPILVLNAVMFYNIHVTAIPVSISKDISIQRILENMGIEKDADKIAEAIHFVSQRTDISPELIIALIHTESEFKKYAKSSMNYKGYTQIPYPIYHEDANILVGMHILKEKLELTNGDLEKALCLYKGWSVNHPRGVKQAKEVLKLYERLIKI